MRQKHPNELSQQFSGFIDYLKTQKYNDNTINKLQQVLQLSQKEGTISDIDTMISKYDKILPQKSFQILRGKYRQHLQKTLEETHSTLKTESKEEITESKEEITESKEEITESKEEITESKEEITENVDELYSTLNKVEKSGASPIVVQIYARDLFEYLEQKWEKISIENLQKSLLILERLILEKAKLKKLGLALMGSYFENEHINEELQKPSWVNLVSTYKPSIEEFMGFINKRSIYSNRQSSLLYNTFGLGKVYEIVHKNNESTISRQPLVVAQEGEQGNTKKNDNRVSVAPIDNKQASNYHPPQLHTEEVDSHTRELTRMINVYTNSDQILSAIKYIERNDNSTVLRKIFLSKLIHVARFTIIGINSIESVISKYCLEFPDNLKIRFIETYFHDITRNNKNYKDKFQEFINNHDPDRALIGSYFDSLLAKKVKKKQEEGYAWFMYPSELLSSIDSLGMLAPIELAQKKINKLLQENKNILKLEYLYDPHTKKVINDQMLSTISEITNNWELAFKSKIETNEYGIDTEGLFILKNGLPHIFTFSERNASYYKLLQELLNSEKIDSITKLKDFNTKQGQKYEVEVSLQSKIEVSIALENKDYNKAESHLSQLGPTIDFQSYKEEFEIKKIIEKQDLSSFIGNIDILARYDKSEAIRDKLNIKLEATIGNDKSLKGKLLDDYLDSINPIITDQAYDRVNKELKKLLCKRAIKGYKNYSSLYRFSEKNQDLYLHILLESGEDLDRINDQKKVAYKKARQMIKFSDEYDRYDNLINLCEANINYFEEKNESTKYVEEWKTLKEKSKKNKYEKRLYYIIESGQRVVSKKSLQEPKYQTTESSRYSFQSTTYYTSDPREGNIQRYDYSSKIPEKYMIIYFDKEQIPKEFETLYKTTSSFFEDEKEISKRKKELLKSRFTFYESTENYEGIEMLELVYGYMYDRKPQLRKQLTEFLNSDEKEKIDQLTELIALFGMSNAADILYQLYPQYKGLPPEEIESILSNYLGNTLLNHSGMGLHHIPQCLNISGSGFLDSILTVIEKDFVLCFTKWKKEDISHDNEVLCKRYIDDLQCKFDSIEKDRPEFTKIIQSFSHFLEQVLEVKKPEKFVHSLVKGREFPDLLQKLNAALVKEKQRFLIADGMGMGKSLSAILAKEHCNAKSCLVIVPSLVEGTRESYLSDIDNKQNKKRGYYKPGATPNTLLINNKEDLKKLFSSPYDYVIISQEKLQSDDYVYELLGVHFDFMIVDEIHKLKNINEGKRAGGLLTITQHIEEQGGNVCLLSGTPIPNKVADIGILLKLLYPEKFGTMESKDLVYSIIQGGDTLNLRSLLLPMMQMKKLTDHIDMPELHQDIKYITLTSEEQLYYDSFVEESTLTGSEKVMLLRKFLLNPQLLGINSITQSTKAKIIGQDANILFEHKNKIVFFINSFTNGVIRPMDGVSSTFIQQMNLNEDIEIRVIDGANSQERQIIQDEFNSSNKKIALFISGQTADVGIDLTAGEHIIHINDPRTMADKDQQEARVYRFGQDKDISSTTYVTKSTIEQGINDYIKMKHDIILKLYFGIKLSDLEKRVITETEIENKKGPSESVNSALTNYIRSSKEKLNNMFGYLREGGIEKIESLVERRGKEMAEYYEILGPRSYQANVNRLHATLINAITGDKEAEIVDLGSGPHMLQQQLDQSLKHNIVSVDINPHHFSEQEKKDGSAVVANFATLPFKEASKDILSSSLSLNETAWSRPNKVYERLEVLLEMYRVLKPGGTAIISTIYSLKYKYPYELQTLLQEIGFEILDAYSGEICSLNSSFSSKTLVLKKVEKQTFRSYRFYGENHQHRIEELSKRDDIKGLDMIKDDVSLSGQEYVLDEVIIRPNNNATVKEKKIKIHLNDFSKRIQQSEITYKNIVDEMKNFDGVTHISDIKNETLLKRGFGRYTNKGSCVLMVRLPNKGGLFRYSSPLKPNQ